MSALYIRDKNLGYYLTKAYCVYLLTCLVFNACSKSINYEFFWKWKQRLGSGSFIPEEFQNVHHNIKQENNLNLKFEKLKKETEVYTTII